MIYRDPNDDVHFMEMNPVSARLMQLLKEKKPNTGRGLLLRIAAELNHPRPEVVIAGGADLLQQWRNKGIVVGSVPVAARD